jgi:hypothetical protein
MAHAAEQRVVRPHRQHVFAGFFELLHVLEALGGMRDRLPFPFADIGERDVRERRRVPAVLVDPPRRVKDLEDAVGVEREEQPANLPEVPVQPLHGALSVLHRAGDEERCPRSTKPNLHIDAERGDAQLVLRRGCDLVVLPIRAGRLGHEVHAFDVDLTDFGRLVEAR